jgi:capsule polysaccharide export protein KpsE/RkpR
MADRNVVVSIKWQWQDRGGVFGRTRKRHEEATYPLADYRKGLHGGEALADRQMFDVISALQDDLHDLTGEIKTIRDVMEEPRRKRQIEAYKARRAEEEAAAQTAAPRKTTASRKRGAGNQP